MLKQGRVYMIGIDHIAEIANLQRGPKETADAPGVVAPSHARAMLQLFGFQIPSPCLLDFSKGGFFAGSKVFGTPMLFMSDGLKEILGLAADVGWTSRSHHSMTALA